MYYILAILQVIQCTICCCTSDPFSICLGVSSLCPCLLFYSLQNFVREQILQAMAVIIKRGTMDSSESDRELLFADVTQLISSGQLSMVEWRTLSTTCWCWWSHSGCCCYWVIVKPNKTCTCESYWRKNKSQLHKLKDFLNGFSDKSHIITIILFLYRTFSTSAHSAVQYMTSM